MKSPRCSSRAVHDAPVYTARTERSAEILEYVAKENPAAADRVGRAIFDAITLIAARPHLGIRNARTPELRSRLVTRYPYRIHYFVEDANVWIIHIRHSARRPWRLEP